jgi:alanine dehydrogenase
VRVIDTSALTIDDCIPAVEEIFRAYGEGRVAPPASLGIDHFHIKAAIGDVFAVKINANFPDNPRKHGLPTIQGVIVLFDRERGTPLAVMDSIAVTTLRTAAATAVAAKYLARRDATTLAVIGGGTQGRAQVEAIKRVRDIERVMIYDSDPKISQCNSIEEAVADADIIVTCTPSQSPLLDARHLRPGLFIAGVGADNPRKHELSPALLKESRVVADILEQSATMGDLHHAIEAGVMTREDVAGELADVVCGRVVRRSEDEVFVFDSTGTALQDLAAAQLLISAGR